MSEATKMHLAISCNQCKHSLTVTRPTSLSQVWASSPIITKRTCQSTSKCPITTTATLLNPCKGWEQIQMLSSLLLRATQLLKCHKQALKLSLSLQRCLRVQLKHSHSSHQWVPKRNPAPWTQRCPNSSHQLQPQRRPRTHQPRTIHSPLKQSLNRTHSV